MAPQNPGAFPGESDDHLDSLEDFLESTDAASMISPDEIEAFQKEITVMVFNLWQCVKTHEDDIRNVLTALKGQVDGPDSADGSGSGEGATVTVVDLAILLMVFVMFLLMIYSTFFRH